MSVPVTFSISAMTPPTAVVIVALIDTTRSRSSFARSASASAYLPWSMRACTCVWTGTSRFAFTLSNSVCTSASDVSAADVSADTVAVMSWSVSP